MPEGYESIFGMTPIPTDLDDLLASDFSDQRGFSYSKSAWRSWTGHFDGVGTVLDELPDSLSRRDVAVLVDNLLPKNVAGAFVVAMIWGHGSSGYGPFRTASVLTGSKTPKEAHLSREVVQQLEESVAVAREQGTVEGYRYLNNAPGKISGLGPAFFTKWLYFVTAQGDATSMSAAPVLDILVISWLQEHAGIKLRTGYTKDYEQYVALLGQWGAQHNLSPAVVEEAIFRVIRNDGK